MIKISSLLDLNGYKKENIEIEVFEDNNGNGIIEIGNKKEAMITSIKYSNRKRIKPVKALEKIIGVKIKINELLEEEILQYIEGKGHSKKIWSPIGKAMSHYKMLEENDRLGVGLSGGKDSMTLINALVRIKKISKVNFEIIPIHIHPVEDISEIKEIKDYCKNIGLELIVIETKLSEFLFKENGGMSNPCFMCGRIRRGILYSKLKELGIKKLLLGHHKDDIIETFLMNSFYQGNLHMMKPSYTSKEHNIKVLRPLAYVEERDILNYVKDINLPILKSKCPYETSIDSKRLRIKRLVSELSNEEKNYRSIVFNSIRDLLKDE